MVILEDVVGMVSWKGRRIENFAPRRMIAVEIGLFLLLRVKKEFLEGLGWRDFGRKEELDGSCGGINI